MRHTDLRLTMNVYTDPRVFDMAGAVEKLPTMGAMERAEVKGSGTGNQPLITNTLLAGRSESVSSPSAPIRQCSASIGNMVRSGGATLTLVGGRDRQQKTPSGGDGAKERVKGVEPSTFTLAT